MDSILHGMDRTQLLLVAMVGYMVGAFLCGMVWGRR